MKHFTNSNTNKRRHSLLLVFILLLTIPFMAVAQTKRITGTINDAEGKGLPGVSIVEKGTTNGASTDNDGNYSISVSSPNAILVFRSIGFLSTEEKVGDRKVVSITLSASIDDLDEVVVIGYGTKVKKKDLTGAVVSANLDNATTSSNVSIAQALQGSVPGLNIGAVAGAGQNPSLSIRAQNTLSSKGDANAPLIVVDGIIYRGNLIDINPSDIGSIDVLKDASSAAIYGSEASNGVILITTKAGKFSDKPIVEYSGSYSLQTPSNELVPMQSEEYKKFYTDIFWAEGARVAPDFLQTNPDYVQNFASNQIREGYQNGRNTNWWDLFTQNGQVSTHNLSIRGKNKTIGYFVSGGLTDQKGYLKNDAYKRYNLRINLDFKVNSWLDIGTQSYVSIGDYSGIPAETTTAFYLQPWAPVYDAAGEYETFPQGNFYLNPYLTISQKDVDINKNFSSNLYANIKLPLEGLSYRINYANNYRTANKSLFNPNANNLTGQATKNYSETRDYTIDNILTYQKTFAKGHTVSATLLYGAEKRNINSFSAQGNQFAIDALGFNRIQAGDPLQNVIASNKEVETSLYSMARVLYDYKGKYYFTGTIRRDGFSGFGENKKIGVFPTVALGWVLTEETFLNKVAWLNFLKLRGSYGQTGRRGVGRYDTKAIIATGPSYVFGDGGTSAQGQSISSLANNDLGWETTTGANLGIDFALFKSRLSGNIDFYKNRTKNILYAIAIPNITGFNTINTNVAEVSNHGLDVSLTGAIINNNDWKWNATINYSRYRNKIASILGVDNNGDGVEDDLVGNGLFIGQPQSVIYGYDVIGMWQLQDQTNGTLPAGFYPGTYKLSDLNGDGKISSIDDRRILGYADPSYRFGISNNISYKNFSLYIFINSIQGGKKFYYGNDSPHANGSWNKRDQLSYSNVPTGAWDYWMPENPNAKYRRLDLASQYGGDLYTQRSFIRLQDVSLSYRFPKSITNAIKISNLKMFVSAKNLLTITNWNGVDPETGAGFTPDAPVLKSYTMGLNVEF